MKKYNSGNYSVKHLQALLKKHADSVLKQDERRQKSASLEEQEKEMLESADLTDKQQLENVKDVRLQKDINAAQIAKLASAGGEILSDINEECEELIYGLKLILSKKAGECIARIAGNLSPFFFRRDSVAMREAQAIFKRTSVARKISELEYFLIGEALNKKVPFLKAQVLLQISPRVMLLEITHDDPEGVLWGVKSNEKHEDEELERLTTAMGREDRIQTMMSESDGRLSRDKAEEAVQRRIELLQAEQKRRGKAKR